MSFCFIKTYARAEESHLCCFQSSSHLNKSLRPGWGHHIDEACWGRDWSRVRQRSRVLSLTVGPNALISQKWGIGRLLRMMRLYRSMFVPPSVWILITLLPSTSHVTKFGLSWSQWVSGTSKPGGAQSTLACQAPSAPKYKSVSLAGSQIHTSEVEVEAEKTKILEL